MKAFLIVLLGLVLCVSVSKGADPAADIQLSISPHASSGPEIEIKWAEGFTGLFDVVATTNLMTDWELVTLGRITEGDANIYWADQNPTPFSFPARFFLAGDGHFDSDGDMLPDAQEHFIYHTDRSSADTDGDGIGDGDETHGNGTYGDTDGYLTDPLRPDSTHFGPNDPLNANATFSLPDLPIQGPDVDLSAFPPFNPPTDAGTLPLNVPAIAEWTRQNQPGDTMALTGENLSDPTLRIDTGNLTSEQEEFLRKSSEGRDTRFLFFAETERGRVLKEGAIQRLDGRQCAITLPESLPPDEMYLIWPHNEHGFGEPVAINQTEAWWIGPDRVTTHETFSIYGRNLALGSTNSYAYCVEQDQWLTNAVACNPYRVEFAVPENWPNGTYTIYAHNGHGRGYGWSKSLTLTVFNRHDWNAGTIYNVTDAPYNATGDGITDDYAAIASALDAAGSGDTVYFPAGTYLISRYLNNAMHNIRVMGDGMGSSIIKAHPSLTDIALVNKGINNSLFQDITFASNVRNEKDDMSLMRIGASSGAIFKNVRFDQRADTEFFGSLMEGGGMNHTSFSNCEFYASGNIYLGDATGRQVFFEDCDFYGLNDNNTLISANGREYSILRCTLQNHDNSDAVEGYGWCKGRWISGQGKTWGGPKLWYFGNNRTYDLCPRRPASRFTGTPSQVVDVNSNIVYFDDLSSLTNVTSALRLTVLTGDVAPNYSEISSFDTDTGLVALSKNWIDLYRDPPSTNDLIMIGDSVDANSGEAVMTESMPAVYRGIPTSTSSNTATFADLSMDYSRHSVTIVNGRGVGQTREIESFSSGTITLDKSWRVVPDANSVLIIGEGFHGLVAYGNYFDGTENSIDPDWDSASAGVEPYGMVSDWIVDGNTFESLRQGIAEYGMVEPMGGIYTVQPSYFCMYKNNIITNCYEGITRELIFATSASSYNIDPLIVGSIFRENKIVGCFSAIRCDLSNTSRAEDFVYLSAYDSNTSSDCYQAFIGRSGMLNQIWADNELEGSTVSAETTGNNPPLQGNILKYDPENSISEYAVLELPVRVVDALVPIQEIPIWNSGITPMFWVGMEASPWLTLMSGDGTIASNIIPEQSISACAGIVTNQSTSGTLYLGIDKANANGVAVITIIANGQVKQLTVHADGTATSTDLYNSTNSAPIVKGMNDFLINEQALSNLCQRTEESFRFIPNWKCEGNESNAWSDWNSPEDWKKWRKFWRNHRNMNQCNSWKEWHSWDEWTDFWEDRRILKKCRNWEQWKQLWKRYLIERKTRELAQELEGWLTGTWTLSDSREEEDKNLRTRKTDRAKKGK